MGSVRNNMRLCVLSSLSFMLLVAAGVGCAAGGRGAGEACAVTADCRADLDLLCLGNTCETLASCGNGRCEYGETPSNCCLDCVCPDGTCNARTMACQAPSCADAGRACIVSTDCCGLLTCQGRVCARAPAGPVCGNKKCEAGETPATCCGDCGCPAGFACQAGACRVTATVLNWTVVNGCFNGADIQYRFFAEDRGLEWPGGSLVFISKQGQTVANALSCIPGEKVCFGADQPNRGLEWGVGINNTGSCADCCYACANRSVSIGPLTCP